VQREYELFAVRWRTFKIATTDSDHGLAVYRNHLAETVVTGVNQAWVADISYIRIMAGFVYLAAILDRYSRKVVGWAISQRIDSELCLAALRTALDQRRPPPGCIHHSDRGVQYASHEYVTMLEGAGMLISMSRTGNPYDNAHMESFFKTLKYEEVHLANYETYEDVLERLSPQSSVKTLQTEGRSPSILPNAISSPGLRLCAGGRYFHRTIPVYLRFTKEPYLRQIGSRYIEPRGTPQNRRTCSNDHNHQTRDPSPRRPYLFVANTSAPSDRHGKIFCR
jgi:transposase InsO family protein